MLFIGGVWSSVHATQKANMKEFCSKSPKWSIGATMFVLQQLSGINVVFYFSPTVFRNVGISSDLFASV